MFRKLEKKFGRYAIKNLTRYVIFTYVLGYLLMMFAPKLQYYIVLDPSKVLEGEVWRIVTWLLWPPTGLSLFIIFTLFFYYSIGVHLEKIMGDFAYNLFIFGGIFITTIASFVVYFISPYFMDGGIHVSFTPTTYFLCMSSFIVFAFAFPDMQVLFMFFIPLKIKWLAYIDIAYLLVEFFYGNIVVKTMIIASMLNLIIYFLFGRRTYHIRPSQIKRKQEFKAQVKQPINITRHKCAVCGRTERDGDLTFRFCSKCNGNYEYCSDHLYTHEHKL